MKSKAILIIALGITFARYVHADKSGKWKLDEKKEKNTHDTSLSRSKRTAPDSTKGESELSTKHGYVLSPSPAGEVSTGSQPNRDTEHSVEAPQMSTDETTSEKILSTKDEELFTKELDSTVTTIKSTTSDSKKPEITLKTELENSYTTTETFTKGKGKSLKSDVMTTSQTSKEVSGKDSKESQTSKSDEKITTLSHQTTDSPETAQGVTEKPTLMKELKEPLTSKSDEKITTLSHQTTDSPKTTQGVTEKPTLMKELKEPLTSKSDKKITTLSHQTTDSPETAQGVTEKPTLMKELKDPLTSKSDKKITTLSHQTTDSPETTQGVTEKPTLMKELKETLTSKSDEKITTLSHQTTDSPETTQGVTEKPLLETVSVSMKEKQPTESGELKTTTLPPEVTTAAPLRTTTYLTENPQTSQDSTRESELTSSGYFVTKEGTTIGSGARNALKGTSEVKGVSPTLTIESTDGITNYITVGEVTQDTKMLPEITTNEDDENAKSVTTISQEVDKMSTQGEMLARISTASIVKPSVTTAHSKSLPESETQQGSMGTVPQSKVTSLPTKMPSGGITTVTEKASYKPTSLKSIDSSSIQIDLVTTEKLTTKTEPTSREVTSVVYEKTTHRPSGVFGGTSMISTVRTRPTESTVKSIISTSVTKADMIPSVSSRSTKSDKSVPEIFISVVLQMRKSKFCQKESKFKSFIRQSVKKCLAIDITNDQVIFIGYGPCRDHQTRKRRDESSSKTTTTVSFYLALDSGKYDPVLTRSYAKKVKEHNTIPDSGELSTFKEKVSDAFL